MNVHEEEEKLEENTEHSEFWDQSTSAVTETQA